MKVSNGQYELLNNYSGIVTLKGYYATYICFLMKGYATYVVW